MDLEAYFPRLTELELAVALDACRKAGAVNAAVALSNHITRLTIDLERLTQQLAQSPAASPAQESE